MRGTCVVPVNPISALSPKDGLSCGHARLSARNGRSRRSATLPETSAAEVQPVETMPPPKDPETTWRYTRLAITAAMVVLLFVVWIWQKRTGR